MREIPDSFRRSVRLPIVPEKIRTLTNVNSNAEKTGRKELEIASRSLGSFPSQLSGQPDPKTAVVLGEVDRDSGKVRVNHTCHALDRGRKARRLLRSPTGPKVCVTKSG